MAVVSYFQNACNTVIVIPSKPLKVLMQCKGTSLYPGCLVETIQTANTDVDRYEITGATQYSTKSIGFIDYNLENQALMTTVANSTTFADKDFVWVVLGACVVEAVLKAEQGTVLPGKRLISGGSGTLQIHPENQAVTPLTTGSFVATENVLSGYAIDPTVAIMLSRATTSAATQRVQVLMTWG